MSSQRLLCRIGAALVVVAALSGCGYHPVVPRGAVADANGINVVLFANKSYRAGVESVLGRHMIDEFSLRTGGRVLPAHRADLELTGTVISYGTTPVSYTAADAIKEYRAVLTVQAVLREQRSQKVLWKGDLSEQQVYPVNADIALQQNAEDAAIEKVCRRLSERVWQQISQRF